METTNTVRAFKVSENDRFTTYSILVAHAGRTDRTGGKVHRAGLLVWKDTGKITISNANCSGSLKGSPITDGRGFGATTCKSCSLSVENVARFDAGSVLIDLGSR